jgi:hypothetical protein
VSVLDLLSYINPLKRPVFHDSVHINNCHNEIQLKYEHGSTAGTSFTEV